MTTMTLAKVTQCTLAPSLRANSLFAQPCLKMWHDLRDFLQNLSLSVLIDVEKQGTFSESDSLHKVMPNVIRGKWPLSLTRLL